mmetsp:Transcript_1967/g.3447  ORF Transcript_1967/g.3447 Transcript_1967/m.3447 type:complete len:144 (-) Transcript_1967:69-500(-)
MRNGEFGVKNRNAERRKIKQMQDDNDKLSRASNIAEEIGRSGSQILGQIKQQTDTLVGVNQKAMKMLSTLGVSDGILTRIEQRSKGDLIIFCALCLFTLLFIYFLNSVLKPALYNSSPLSLFSSSDSSQPATETSTFSEEYGG